MKRSFLLLLMSAISLSGCQMERPDQDNFEIDASRGGIEPFVAALSKNLSARAVKTKLQAPDADPGWMFTVTGDGFTIIIQSMGDHRCIPQPHPHTTYRESKYYIDLVYRTDSMPEHDSIKNKLLRSAEETNQPIKKFAECKYG